MIHEPHQPAFLQDWLSHLQQQGKSQLTLHAYRRAVLHFMQWCQQTYGEPFELTAIMPRDVRDWKAYQQSVEKAASRTVNQRLVGLSRLFRWAVSTGQVRTNPAMDVKSIPLPALQPGGVLDTSLRKLLRTVHRSGHIRNTALLELLAGTGLRVSELLQLQVGDIQVGERSGHVTVRRGKQGNFRQVPLTTEVRHALWAYLDTHANQKEPDAPLWVGTRGALTQRSSILRILQKYALLAGLPAVYPHAFRHSFAIRYLKHNPGDLRGLATVLGHTSLDTVMIYTAPSLADLAERMEKMDFPSA